LAKKIELLLSKNIFLQKILHPFIFKTISNFTKKNKTMTNSTGAAKYVIFILLLMAAGCTVKKLAKQAVQFEQAGMFKDAAGLYLQALALKPGAFEYKTGLKRTGQLYLDESVAAITSAYNRNDYQTTIYGYRSMQDFASTVRSAGVDLDFDYSTERMYEKACEVYLSERYELGQKLLNEQSFGEAEKVFSEIHSIQPEYKDTRNYLLTSTLEPLYQKGSNHFSRRNFMNAYKEWEKVYQKNPDYKDVKMRMQEALDERYKEGTLWLIEEDFDAAAAALGEVYQIAPDYPDVKARYMEARNEPIYRTSKENLKTGKCRTAYFGFESIIKDAGNYKETKVLKDEALNCAQFPVAVLVGAMPQHNADAAEFEAALTNRLLSYNDPFLKIHQFPDMNSKFFQAVASSRSPDRKKLKELTDTYGIKAILMISFAEYEKNEGKLQKFSRTGFERQPVRKTNGETSYYDHQVSYTEYLKQNKASLEMSYQLVSAANGQILLSQRLTGNKEDQTNYATYQGNQKNLYPAKEINNTYSIDLKNYHSLQKLLKSDDRIQSADQLRDDLFEDLSKKIAKAVIEFNPEK